MLSELGETEEALKAFDKAIGLSPVILWVITKSIVLFNDGKSP